MSERYIPKEGDELWDYTVKKQIETQREKDRKDRREKENEESSKKFFWWWLIFLISFSLIGGIYIFVKENI